MPQEKHRAWPSPATCWIQAGAGCKTAICSTCCPSCQEGRSHLLFPYEKQSLETIRALLQATECSSFVCTNLIVFTQFHLPYPNGFRWEFLWVNDMKKDQWQKRLLTEDNVTFFFFFFPRAVSIYLIVWYLSMQYWRLYTGTLSEGS